MTAECPVSAVTEDSLEFLQIDHELRMQREGGALPAEAGYLLLDEHEIPIPGAVPAWVADLVVVTNTERVRLDNAKYDAERGGE